MRLDILFFLGYDIDEELPWHSTISRTRSLYGEEVFRKLFKAVLFLCVKKRMVSDKRQAIDSAFIKANASLDSVAEKEVITDAESFLSELGENDENKVSATKKAEVEYHHTWKEKTYKDQPGKARENKELYEFGNTIRPRYLSNHTHYSTTDRDARISVKPGKPRQFNYTAQTSVDTQNHAKSPLSAFIDLIKLFKAHKNFHQIFLNKKIKMPISDLRTLFFDFWRGLCNSHCCYLLAFCQLLI